MPPVRNNTSHHASLRSTLLDAFLRRFVATGQVASNSADFSQQQVTAFMSTVHSTPPKPGTGQGAAQDAQRLRNLHDAVDKSKVGSALRVLVMCSVVTPLQLLLGV
jgi:hypothetical protein